MACAYGATPRAEIVRLRGDRLRDRRGDLAFGPAQLLHAAQHAVAPLLRSRRIVIRCEPTWRREDCRERRCLRDVELGRVDAPVVLRGRTEAAHGEVSVLSEVGRVQVHLEHAVLSDAALELDGEQRLADLATQRLLLPLGEIPHDLHREGRSALPVPAAAS